MSSPRSFLFQFRPLAKRVACFPLYSSSSCSSLQAQARIRHREERRQRHFSQRNRSNQGAPRFSRRRRWPHVQDPSSNRSDCHVWICLRSSDRRRLHWIVPRRFVSVFFLADAILPDRRCCCSELFSRLQEDLTTEPTFFHSRLESP